MTDLFRTRDFVPDFDAIVDDYRTRSERTRSTHTSRLDVFYGDHPDERLDLFFPDRTTGSAPVHLFIHGGYWRANRKEDYAFMAEPVLAAGGIAAIAGYTLMPKVRLTHLVEQVRRAAGWLVDNAVSFGANASSLTASGHSAGAHLAFYLAAKGPHESSFPRAGVSQLLLISGIYDLEPLSRSFLQQEISLRQDEISNWSPIGAKLRDNVIVRSIVGSLETPPFQQQADELCRRHGVGNKVLAGLDHMTIVRDIGSLGTPGAHMLRMMLQAN